MSFRLLRTGNLEFRSHSLPLTVSLIIYTVYHYWFYFLFSSHSLVLHDTIDKSLPEDYSVNSSLDTSLLFGMFILPSCRIRLLVSGLLEPYKSRVAPNIPTLHHSFPHYPSSTSLLQNFRRSTDDTLRIWGRPLFSSSSLWPILYPRYVPSPIKHPRPTHHL